jgi:hypothetical protein
MSSLQSIGDSSGMVSVTAVISVMKNHGVGNVSNEDRE